MYSKNWNINIYHKKLNLASFSHYSQLRLVLLLRDLGNVRLVHLLLFCVSLPHGCSITTSLLVIYVACLRWVSTLFGWLTLRVDCGPCGILPSRRLVLNRNPELLIIPLILQRSLQLIHEVKPLSLWLTI